MSDMPIDPDTGDIDPSVGESSTGDELIAQRLRIRLQLQLGESSFFPDDGVDWLGMILGKSYSIARLNLQFVPAVLGTDGIAQIVDHIIYNLDRRTQKLTVTVNAVTENGETITVEV